MPARARSRLPAALLPMVIVLACNLDVRSETTTSTSPTTTQAAATPTTSASTTTTSIPAPVVLEVLWPVDGFVTTEPELVVSGMTSGEATVIVNGEEAFINSDEDLTIFDRNVRLTAGDNEISVVAQSPDATPAEILLDVRYLPDADVEFAFVVRVSAEEVVADYAQFLTGQEAIDAAVEDGVTTPEEGVPNDYYIRNVNTQLRTLPVSSDAVVILASSAAGAVAGVRVSVSEWLSLFHEDGTPYDLGQEEPPPVEGPHSGFFGAGWGAPYWITIDGDEVVQIYQQYLP